MRPIIRTHDDDDFGGQNDKFNREIARRSYPTTTTKHQKQRICYMATLRMMGSVWRRGAMRV